MKAYELAANGNGSSLYVTYFAICMDKRFTVTSLRYVSTYACRPREIARKTAKSAVDKAQYGDNNGKK